MLAELATTLPWKLCNGERLSSQPKVGHLSPNFMALVVGSQSRTGSCQLSVSLRK
jgi:hypothetical protein